MSGELIDTAAAGGAARASQTLPATLAMSFLAGAYIALGGFLACLLYTSDAADEL